MHTCVHTYTHNDAKVLIDWSACQSELWFPSGSFPSCCVSLCVCVCACVCVFSLARRSSIFSCARKLSLFFDFQLERQTALLSAFIYYLLHIYLLPPTFLISPPVLCFHFHLFFLSFYVPHSKRPPLSSVISYSLHLILSTSGSMTLISVFIKPLDDFISFSLNATFLVFASGTQAYSAVHKPFTVDVLWTIGLRPGCQHLTRIRVTTPNWWLAITQRWLLSSSHLLFSLSSLYGIYTHHTLD